MFDNLLLMDGYTNPNIYWNSNEIPFDIPVSLREERFRRESASLVRSYSLLPHHNGDLKYGQILEFDIIIHKLQDCI